MSTAPVSLRLVLITAPDAEHARRLAAHFVEARLAACVNIVPQVTSVYRWQGKVCEEGECLLIVKTTQGALAALEAANASEHPYDCPEFVVLDPTHVSADYLAWIGANTRD
jgi:periplasmic divalent cation tolerance protein